MKERVVTGLVLMCVIGLAGCGGPEERKEKYRLRAQEYFEQGNYPKARVALRNVLKIDPKDAEAYYLYAQVEEKEKNWRNAVAGYQQVVELSPDHERALLKLGKYYLEVRALDMVGEVSDRILTKTQDHVGARALKIAATALSGRLADATAAAEQLNAEAPTEVDAVLLLASLYTASRNGCCPCCSAG
jgi:tetratricopeptide (TPR) repeat protein